MKTKKVPFDITKAKAGAKVVTRCGYPVRISDFDVKNKDGYTILGIINIKGNEVPFGFTKTGTRGGKEESDYDLFIEEVEETDDYNPYKEVVKSIADMAERYADSGSDLQDFYDNVKVQCKDAVEYERIWCKKQGEQRPSDSLEIMPDKWYTCIESWSTIDMKIGDWFEEDHYYLGSDILKYRDLLEKDGDFKDYFHPWNISDVKDGDILFHSDTASNGIFIFKEIAQDKEVICYCDYDSEDGFCLFDEYHTCCWADSKILYPATKEQYDLLFQKMKDAGYEWDKEKKELKKIEKAKTRRMTNQELSGWLQEHPEEHREMTYSDEDNYVSPALSYLKSEANTQVYEDIRIRKNGGEWMEPLVNI